MSEIEFIEWLNYSGFIGNSGANKVFSKRYKNAHLYIMVSLLTKYVWVTGRYSNTPSVPFSDFKQCQTIIKEFYNFLDCELKI